MWPVRFTEAARAELIEAHDWYEAEAPGLGHRFRAEIDSVVERMADNPRQFPMVFKTLRRARAKRFPYALFFLVEPEALLVVALFPQQPRPPPVAKARMNGISFGAFCRFQLIRRPNDFQPHYFSIKSRQNAVFSAKSCTVWSHHLRPSVRDRWHPFGQHVTDRVWVAAKS